MDSDIIWNEVVVVANLIKDIQKWYLNNQIKDKIIYLFTSML